MYSPNKFVRIIDSMRKGKMKAGRLVIMLSLFVVSNSNSSETGEILIMPYSVKQVEMGEVGTSLAGDEAVMFRNPAGLGKDNLRWRRGAHFCLYQSLSNSSDSKRQAVSLSNKPQKYEIGGVGLVHNHSQHPEESFREYLPGISYGKQIVKK